MKEFQFKIDGKEYKTSVTELEGGITEVTVNGKAYKVEMEAHKAAPKTAAPKAAAPAAASKAEAAAAAGLSAAGDRRKAQRHRPADDRPPGKLRHLRRAQKPL